MKNILILLLMVVIAGCTSMNTPSSTLIDSVPVVNVGELNDVPEDYIVLIPAGNEFPMVFSVKGSIFNRNVSSTVMTSVKQDIYLYKYWASLDGKHWVNSHKLMSVEPSGGFDKSGGKLEVKINLVE
ncbi:MAG: hypothetical protein P8163_00310 [Candidatus Thiodiazotropha sp.]